MSPICISWIYGVNNGKRKKWVHRQGCVVTQRRTNRATPLFCNDSLQNMWLNGNELGLAVKSVSEQHVYGHGGRIQFFGPWNLLQHRAWRNAGRSGQQRHRSQDIIVKQLHSLVIKRFWCQLRQMQGGYLRLSNGQLTAFLRNRKSNALCGFSAAACSVTDPPQKKALLHFGTVSRCFVWCFSCSGFKTCLRM